MSYNSQQIIKKCMLVSTDRVVCHGTIVDTTKWLAELGALALTIPNAMESDKKSDDYSFGVKFILGDFKV